MLLPTTYHHHSRLLELNLLFCCLNPDSCCFFSQMSVAFYVSAHASASMYPYLFVKCGQNNVIDHPTVITIFYRQVVWLPFPVMFGLWHGFFPRYAHKLPTSCQFSRLIVVASCGILQTPTRFWKPSTLNRKPRTEFFATSHGRATKMLVEGTAMDYEHLWFAFRM